MNQFIFVVIQLAEHLGVVRTQALLGCAGMCLQGSMTSTALGSPGPYSDPKRAKSPWNPKDTTIQLPPLFWTIFPAYPEFQNSLPGGHAQPLLQGHKAVAIPPQSEFAGQICQPSLLSNMPTVGTWAFWLLRFTSERRKKCCVYQKGSLVKTAQWCVRLWIFLA